MPNKKNGDQQFYCWNEGSFEAVVKVFEISKQIEVSKNQKCENIKIFSQK